MLSAFISNIAHVVDGELAVRPDQGEAGSLAMQKAYATARYLPPPYSTEPSLMLQHARDEKSP